MNKKGGIAGNLHEFQIINKDGWVKNGSCPELNHMEVSMRIFYYIGLDIQQKVVQNRDQQMAEKRSSRLSGDLDFTGQSPAG